MSVKKAFDWGLNVALVAMLLFLCFRPAGAIRGPYSRWVADRRTAELIREHWPDLVRGPRLGSSSPNARVIVEFSDFQCPFCAQSSSALNAYLADHPDVAVVYRNLPLNGIHRHAEEAALAGICADSQGAFAALSNFLFENEDWGLDRDVDWPAVGQASGVPDTEAWLACLGSDAARVRLDEDLRLVDLLGLNTTPTFLAHDGRRFVGSIASAQIEALLEGR